MWKIINDMSNSKKGDNSVSVILDENQNQLTEEKDIEDHLNDLLNR